MNFALGDFDNSALALSEQDLLDNDDANDNENHKDNDGDDDNED